MNCLICNNKLTDTCQECQEEYKKYNQETCAIAKGICGHLFHFHCISRHLRKDKKCKKCLCPIHKTEWEFVKYYRDLEELHQEIIEQSNTS